MILTLESAELPVLPMNHSTLSLETATVLLSSSESMELVLNVQEIPLITLKLELAAALLDTDRLHQATVFLDVVLMRFLTTVFAAVLLDTILLEVFVVNVLGMKSMTKVLEFAENLVIQDVFSISANKLVSACLNTTNYSMELVELAQSIQPTTKLLKLVFVIVDFFLTSAFAHLLAMPMKNGSMELANAKRDII